MNDEELKKRLDLIDDRLGGIMAMLAVIGILIVFLTITVGVK